MRVIVWYISVTLLLFMVAVMVLQLFLFLLIWPFGWSFWLLPNFTSDTAPIYELFTPVYTLDKSTGSHPTVRIGLLAAFAVSAVYVARLPPSEFEGFLSGNRKIIDDLYTGALLTDGSGTEGSVAMGGSGRYNNPLNPFGTKFGPGRYGSRSSSIPTLKDIEKETAEMASEGGGSTEDLDSADAATATEGGGNDGGGTDQDAGSDGGGSADGSGDWAATAGDTDGAVGGGRSADEM
jgi:hypothetical protein